MASIVAVTSLLNVTTNSAKYATAAFTPSSGELLVIAVAVAGRTDASADLKDSNGDTYTLVGTYQKDSTSQAFLYVGDLATSAVGRTLSVSFGATATGLNLHLFRVDGMTQFGAAAILQSGFVNSGTAGAQPHVTLGAACTTTNVIIGGVHQNATTIADPPDWTLGVSTSHNTPATRHQSSYRSSGETNSTITWSGSADSVWAAFVAELDGSAGGPATRSATFAATDAPDTFSASARVIVQGRLSATDAQDIFAATSKVIIQGRLSATETVADTFSASGQVKVSGRLSATEAFSDSFSASGYVIVSGRLSATDAQDTFAATGYTLIYGRLSATDVADTFASTAQVIVSGRMSATDAQDIFVALGTPANRSATFAATDAPDTFAATAQVIVSASMSATDIPDTLSASGYVLVRATLAATDAPDAFSASARVIVQARLSATDAPDIFAASASVQNLFITATVDATDAPDTLSASAQVRVTAFLAATDAADTFVATGTVVALSVSAAEATALSSAGHGKRSNDDYQPANDAFWEAREKYLLSLQPEITADLPEIFPESDDTAEPFPIPRLIGELRFERSEALLSIEHARNMRQLRAAGKRLRAVNARLREELAAVQAHIEALQYALDAPKRRRARQLDRLRKQLVLLEMAHSILHLQDHT